MPHLLEFLISYIVSHIWRLCVKPAYRYVLSLPSGSQHIPVLTLPPAPSSTGPLIPPDFCINVNDTIGIFEQCFAPLPPSLKPVEVPLVITKTVEIVRYQSRPAPPTTDDDVIGGILLIIFLLVVILFCCNCCLRSQHRKSSVTCTHPQTITLVGHDGIQNAEISAALVQTMVRQLRAQAVHGSTMEEKVQELEAEKKSLEQAALDRITKYDKLKSENAHLELKSKESEKKIKELKDKTYRLDEKLEAADLDLKKAKEDKDESAMLNSETKKGYLEMAQIRAELDLRFLNHEKHVKQFEQEVENSSTVHALRENNEQLEKKSKKLEKQNEKLANERQQLSDEKQALERKSVNSGEDNKALKEENEKLKAANEELMKEKAQSIETREAAEKEHKGLQKRFSKLEKEKDDFKANAESNMKLARKVAEVLTGELHSSIVLSDLETKFKSFHEQNKQSEERFKALEKENKGQKQQIDANRDAAHAVTTEQNILAIENKSLRSENAELEKSNEKLEALKDTLQNVINQKADEINGLEQKYKESESQREAEKDDFSQKLNSLQVERHNLDNERASINAERQKLATEQSKQNIDSISFEVGRREFQQLKNDLEIKIRDSQDEKANLETIIAERDFDIRRLDAEIDNERKKATNLRIENDVLAEQTELLRTAGDYYMGLWKDLSNGAETLKADVETLQAEMDLRENELEAEKSRAGGMEMNVKILQEEIEKKKEEIETLKDKLDKAEATIEVLQNEVSQDDESMGDDGNPNNTDHDDEGGQAGGSSGHGHSSGNNGSNHDAGEDDNDDNDGHQGGSSGAIHPAHGSESGNSQHHSQQQESIDRSVILSNSVINNESQDGTGMVTQPPQSNPTASSQGLGGEEHDVEMSGPDQTTGPKLPQASSQTDGPLQATQKFIVGEVQQGTEMVEQVPSDTSLPQLPYNGDDHGLLQPPTTASSSSTSAMDQGSRLNLLASDSELAPDFEALLTYSPATVPGRPQLAMPPAVSGAIGAQSSTYVVTAPQRDGRPPYTYHIPSVLVARDENNHLLPRFARTIDEVPSEFEATRGPDGRIRQWNRRVQHAYNEQRGQFENLSSRLNVDGSIFRTTLIWETRPEDGDDTVAHYLFFKYKNQSNNQTWFIPYEDYVISHGLLMPNNILPGPRTPTGPAMRPALHNNQGPSTAASGSTSSRAGFGMRTDFDFPSHISNFPVGSQFQTPPTGPARWRGPSGRGSSHAGGRFNNGRGTARGRR